VDQNRIHPTTFNADTQIPNFTEIHSVLVNHGHTDKNILHFIQSFYAACTMQTKTEN
jgi:hypothetical protein